MTSRTGAESSLRIKEARDQVMMSAGTESMPVCGIMMLPFALAVASYFFIILATHGTSPVTSR